MDVCARVRHKMQSVMIVCWQQTGRSRSSSSTTRVRCTMTRLHSTATVWRVSTTTGRRLTHVGGSGYRPTGDTTTQRWRTSARQRRRRDGRSAGRPTPSTVLRPRSCSFSSSPASCWWCSSSGPCPTAPPSAQTDVTFATYEPIPSLRCRRNEYYGYIRR